MDTFMDKLAQRLNAQEIIRANSAADAEEMGKLKNQVKEYNDCLLQMQEANKELRVLNQKLLRMLDETIEPQIQTLVEEGIQKLEATQVDYEEIDRLMEESMAKLSEMQNDRAAMDELEKSIGEKLESINENIHKECVKVYRNVQAVVVEENSKQTEGIVAEIKKMNGRLKAILGVSIAALIVALGGVAFQVLTYLHIL